MYCCDLPKRISTFLDDLVWEHYFYPQSVSSYQKGEFRNNFWCLNNSDYLQGLLYIDRSFSWSLHLLISFLPLHWLGTTDISKQNTVLSLGVRLRETFVSIGNLWSRTQLQIPRRPNCFIKKRSLIFHSLLFKIFAWNAWKSVWRNRINKQK